jgi:hypothetical protein
MRIVIGLIVALVVVLVLWPLASYGTLDPCRILAKDMARDAYTQMAKAVGAEPGKTPEAAENMARMVTSQYSEGECLSRLKDRWFGVEKPAQ